MVIKGKQVAILLICSAFFLVALYLLSFSFKDHTTYFNVKENKENGDLLEVEKKFDISNEQVQLIHSIATLEKEESFYDTYYDNVNFEMTKKNVWLRKRRGAFELKIGIREPCTKNIDRYVQVDDEKSISDELHLDFVGNIDCALQDAQIFPFCTFKSTRKIYKYQNFNIIIDTADYGDAIYRICEIELMVKSPEEIENAADKILAFSKQLGLKKSQNVPSKLTSYMEKTHPKHFDSLVDAKVVPHKKEDRRQ